MSAYLLANRPEIFVRRMGAGDLMAVVFFTPCSMTSNWGRIPIDPVDARSADGTRLVLKGLETAVEVGWIQGNAEHSDASLDFKSFLHVVLAVLKNGCAQRRQAGMAL